jgi:hypothetical protein
MRIALRCFWGRSRLSAEETQAGFEQENTESTWTPRRGAGGGNTITLKLDDDGNLKPLSERMQSRLREFASREDWQQATGLREGQSSETRTQVGESASPLGAELIDEKKAENILKWLEQTKQMMWGMIGLSEAKRTEICHYSEAQKDLIAPSLASVVNKRSPEWMRKYWPEIQLALFMGTIEIGQFQSCAKSLIEERKSKSGRPSLVREISQPQQPPREARTVERREPVASVEARTEVQKSGEFCNYGGCSEPSVPGVGYCRIHRTMEAAEA